MKPSFLASCYRTALDIAKGIESENRSFSKHLNRSLSFSEGISRRNSRQNYP